MDRPSLQRALDSVAAQTYPNIEIVVVAASGAGHCELPDRCGAFALRLVRSQRPLARADAANAALDAARGDWLNILDDDDELLPAHVATLRAALDEQPHARLAHSLSEDCRADGGFLRYHGGRFKPWRQLDTGFFHPHCAMFARSLVAGGARFDSRFDILEDMDFFIQCAQRTPFAFVKTPTTRYYVDAGDSGAGAGSNRDPARLRKAIDTLRSKWAALEAELRTTPEFRGEQALWLIDQGMLDAASSVIAALREERSDSVDAQALAILLQVARGSIVDARAALARLGSGEPTLDAIVVRLDALRASLAG